MPSSAIAEPKRCPVFTNSVAASKWLCVMALDFAGIERQLAGLEPTGRRGRRAGVFLLGKLLDEAMQPSAIVGAHVHKLNAHAVIGAAMAHDGPGTDLAAGNVEERF